MKKKNVLRGVLISLGVLFGLFLLLVIIFFTIGSTQEYPSSPMYDSYYYSEMGTDGFVEAPTFEVREELDLGMTETQQSDSEDRSLIKTGRISVSVDEIDETLREVNLIKSRYGATTMNLSDYGKGLNRRVSITIRVEQSQFDFLYQSLKGMDGEFDSSSISVSDVTERVLDLEARLKNYRSVEDQYLTILEKAETVEDTLAVYQELNKVRLEIERIETQLKNLETQTEYSYIYLTVSQSSAGAEVADDQWRPEGIFREALRSLVSFLQSVGSVLIWILVFSPIIALVVLPIIHLRKRAKK